jgi:hypothetical protein
MKKITIIWLTIILLVVLGIGYGYILGIFNEITVVEKETGGYKLAGYEYTGSYKKAGAFMKESEEKLNALGITYNRGFGIYYDDPKTTPDEKCRSFIGGIVEVKDINKISVLKSEGLKTDSVRTTSSVVAEFPIKSNLSYSIAPMKVYPAISEYMQKKGYKVVLSLEIYDVPQKKIMFITQYK